MLKVWFWLVFISAWWRKEKRRKERKKNYHREGEFPQGWVRLAGCVAGHSC
jgi:hypothetical protein